MANVFRAAAYAVLFAIGFGLLGAAAGFVIGLGLSAFDEIVLNKGNPQGPLLFLIGGPLGVFVGFFYGAYKGYTKGTTGTSDNKPETNE
jgi:mannose/fructose/N-acetylgalactosamine-specific phosphotransferase system component IID